jgi:hypothetical protein
LSTKACTGRLASGDKGIASAPPGIPSEAEPTPNPCLPPKTDRRSFPDPLISKTFRLRSSSLESSFSGLYLSDFY